MKLRSETTSIHTAKEHLRQGRIVVFIKNFNPHLQAYFIQSAQHVSDESLGFLLGMGSGKLIAALPPDHIHILDSNVEIHSAEYVENQECKDVERGLILNQIGPEPLAEIINAIHYSAEMAIQLSAVEGVDIVRTRLGGVFASATAVDGAADLCRLSELGACCVLAPIQCRQEDFSAEYFREIAREYGLACIDFTELLRFRRSRAGLQKAGCSVRMPTDSGIFSMQLFEDPCTGDYHVALVAGDIRGDEPVLVRLHSECLTGDVFGSRRCDCGPQLKLALDQIITAGTGVCLYLRQEGRGIGLANKLRAYLLQEQGLDTVEANQSLGFPPDLRDYKTAARILTELGVDQVRLMTNNPEKIQGLKSHGIDVVEQVPHHIGASEENENYLYTKQVKMGHLLPDVRGVQKCQP